MIKWGLSINAWRTKCIVIYAGFSYQENRGASCFRASLSQLTPQSFPQGRRCLNTNRNMVDDICVYGMILIHVIMCLSLDLCLGK